MQWLAHAGASSFHLQRLVSVVLLIKFDTRGVGSSTKKSTHFARAKITLENGCEEGRFAFPIICWYLPARSPSRHGICDKFKAGVRNTKKRKSKSCVETTRAFSHDFACPSAVEGAGVGMIEHDTTVQTRSDRGPNIQSFGNVQGPARMLIDSYYIHPICDV